MPSLFRNIGHKTKGQEVELRRQSVGYIKCSVASKLNLITLADNIYYILFVNI
jgi:hypothetical protein